MKKGFTLIELLIVVLIIAILAAIAVPNFLEFQTRAKVSRVKADQRSLATAIEAYYVDNNEYPAMENADNGFSANDIGRGQGSGAICTFRLRTGSEQLSTLTTPVSYITTYPPDPFATTKGTTFGYRQFQYTWVLISWGPDRDEDSGGTSPGDHINTEPTADIQNSGGRVSDNNFETVFELSIGQPSPAYLTGASGDAGTALHYDPTNGTTSEGDVVRVKQ